MELVLITFLDSTQRADWACRQEVIEDGHAALCTVVGWVVEDNEKEVILVSGKASGDYFTLRFTVPKQAILKREILQDED